MILYFILRYLKLASKPIHVMYCWLVENLIYVLLFSYFVPQAKAAVYKKPINKPIMERCLKDMTRLYGPKKAKKICELLKKKGGIKKGVSSETNRTNNCNCKCPNGLLYIFPKEKTFFEGKKEHTDYPLPQDIIRL